MFSRTVIPLLILAAGFAAWWVLGRPVEAPKSVPQPPQVLETTRLELKRTRYPVVLETQGTVRAHHTTTLTAQVAGIVRTIHPAFDDGAFFEEGQVLLELDPDDLAAQKTTAESRLARAEAALAQEEARAKQARLNWEDIGYKEAPSPLVLRVPQLKEATANVTAARAELDQAGRNLERAKVRAPFAGRVSTRLVGPGQAIGATTSLGMIFATDYAEIRLPLSAGQLAFARLPTRANDAPVPVVLTDALDARPSGPAHSWQAKIVRTEGTLDAASRELFAIARIEDPFGLTSGNPELRIGQPVRAAVEGVVLEDVFVLPRNALRGVNRVYVIDKPTLTIKRTDVVPVWSTPTELVMRTGLQEGDWIATSRLSYAPDGAPVVVLETPAAPATLAAPPPTAGDG
jgi:RND family efflux transporter MFP subunit